MSVYLALIIVVVFATALVRVAVAEWIKYRRDIEQPESFEEYQRRIYDYYKILKGGS